MKKLIIFGAILLLIFSIGPAAATYTSCPETVVNNVTISNILTQVQWMTQQQSQSQHQEQTINVASGTQRSWIQDTSRTGQENLGGIQQWSQTYSRLVYPGEVLTFPAAPGSTCTILAGLPIAFYTIGTGQGYYQDQVQTLEAVPTYDPIRHKMEFGGVVVLDRIDYWTMKARLPEQPGETLAPDTAFCVVDNRAPMNGYTTIEVTITAPAAAA